MISITACGSSSKYKKIIHEICDGLQKNGFIVLTPPLHDMNQFSNLNDEGRLLLAKGATFAHFNRIKTTDVCLMINPDGYLGTGSSLELGYAVAEGKLVIALNHDKEYARECLFDIILETEDVAEVVNRITMLLKDK